MKRSLVAAIILCAVMTTQGQGLVNFFNTTSTLVSWKNGGEQRGAINGAPGAYYFGLLTSTSFDPRSYSFSGVYATNQTTPGLFSGGTIAVPGWAAGSPLYYEVFGWSAALGHDFDPRWLQGSFPQFPYGPPPGTGAVVGISFAGYGVAGGTTGTGTLAPLDLFGGAGGLQSGFSLVSMDLAPEPSTASLFAAGAATLMLRWRWNKVQRVG